MRLLSARLSAKRRSPLAGLVVLLLGLLTAGGVYALLAPASAETDHADQSTVSQGRNLFLVGCSSCHGEHGQGILAQGGTTQYGPPLAGVGAAAVDFQVGTGRMPMARPGVQADQKKVLYSPDEIRALAAYVASLGPGPAVPQKSEYDPASIPQDEKNAAVVRGSQFFKTNCTACHNFAGSGGALPGGKYAPSLKNTSNKHVFEAMLTGPQQMPVFSNGVLKPSEKRDIIAYLDAARKDPGYGGLSLGSLGPVTEGLTAWLVGIGVLVGFAIWIASASVRSKKGIKA